MPWQIGRTLVALGELAQQQGDGVAARSHFAEALGCFAALGALPDIARSRAALKALG